MRSSQRTNAQRDEKGDSVKYAITRQIRCEASAVMESQNLSLRKRYLICCISCNGEETGL